MDIFQRLLLENFYFLFDLIVFQKKKIIFTNKHILFFLIVDGVFTAWSLYNKCSVSCGGGSQTRTRSCTNPAPKYDGLDCDGETSQTRPCGNAPCPG